MCSGTGKPAVPDKRVPRVRVRYPIWHTRAEPRTLVRCHGYTRVFLRAESVPPPVTCTSMPTEPQSLMSCLRAFLDGTLGLSDANATLFTLAVSSWRRITSRTARNVLYDSTVHQETDSTTLNALNDFISTMSGRGKGGKGLGKGGWCQASP
jgi:hypothetical protein